MIKFARRFLLLALIFSLLLPLGMLPSHADNHEIDIRYLQECLREEKSSLDVLVLMDSSRSLRDSKQGEPRHPFKGSDPLGQRGPILKSSLMLLAELARESNKDLRVSLRNFGRNQDSDLSKLKEKWLDWKIATKDEKHIDRFVQNALYNDSPGTFWASGLETARDQFNVRLGEAALNGEKSCPIMFWITDGAPSKPEEDKARICKPGDSASIEWFRERNILVLGGLLRPKDEPDADLFRPIVEGENCGQNQETWTRGSVKVADDISSLSYEFTSLIAGIKNLVSLRKDNSVPGGFEVDPGTSHIEMYIRGVADDWTVTGPNRTVFCSANNLGSRCEVSKDTGIGITTIRVFPEDPKSAGGIWSIQPAYANEDIKFYGSLNTATRVGVKLVVTPSESSVEEGKEVTFNAKLVNSDGTDFTPQGYKSVKICGRVSSSPEPTCGSGTNVDLTLNPSTTDSSATFEAILTAESGSGNISGTEEQVYRIYANAKLEVVQSDKYPTLSCPEDPCKLGVLKNKESNSTTKLTVKPAESGATGANIYLKSFTILADPVEGRGDGKFAFQLQRDSERIKWNDINELLVPGDALSLVVSTELGGKGNVQGVIRYVVIADGQEVTRQLSFILPVEDDKEIGILVFLPIFVYLLTIGIPYLYLLWAARRSAVLTLPDNEYATLTAPFKITSDGRLVSLGEQATGSNFDVPDRGKLSKIQVDEDLKSIQIDSAQIEIIPPKWNPFENPKTSVTIPGHLILSTSGKSSFELNEADFSQSVVNEAILHFSAEENISPQAISETVTITDQEDDPFGASSYENRMKEELIPRTGEIVGQAIFIIANHGNRKKSLETLTSKVITSYQSANVYERIKSLRDEALKDAMAKIVADRAALEVEQKIRGKKGKEDKKRRSDGDEKKEPTYTDEELGIDGEEKFDHNEDKGERSIWDEDD